MWRSDCIHINCCRYNVFHHCFFFRLCVLFENDFSNQATLAPLYVVVALDRDDEGASDTNVRDVNFFIIVLSIVMRIIADRSVGEVGDGRFDRQTSSM